MSSIPIQLLAISTMKGVIFDQFPLNDTNIHSLQKNLIQETHQLLCCNGSGSELCDCADYSKLRLKLLFENEAVLAIYDEENDSKGGDTIPSGTGLAALFNPNKLNSAITNIQSHYPVFFLSSFNCTEEDADEDVEFDILRQHQQQGKVQSGSPNITSIMNADTLDLNFKQITPAEEKTNCQVDSILHEAITKKKPNTWSNLLRIPNLSKLNN